MKIFFIIPILLLAVGSAKAQNGLHVYLETFKDSVGVTNNDVCIQQEGKAIKKVFRADGKLEHFEVLVLSDTSFCFLLQTFPVCSYSKYVQNSSGVWETMTGVDLLVHSMSSSGINYHEPHICSLLGEDQILVKKDDGTEQIVTAPPFGEGLKVKKD